MYKELEFVCHNSTSDGSTSKESQKKLYKELQQLQISTGYGILPYMQDFSDDTHEEISLAVVILDKNNEKELEKQILELAKKTGVEFDLYGKRNDKEVDGLVRGNLYDNIIKESVSTNQLKDALIKRSNEYMKHFKRTIPELNNGLCEEIAMNVIEDIGGETKNTYSINDGLFWDSDKVSKYKTGTGDEYWNIKNFKKYGEPPFDYKLLSTFDLAGHTWIYHNGKHYDVETLDGVKNF